MEYCPSGRGTVSKCSWNDVRVLAVMLSKCWWNQCPSAAGIRTLLFSLLISKSFDMGSSLISGSTYGLGQLSTSKIR